MSLQTTKPLFHPLEATNATKSRKHPLEPTINVSVSCLTVDRCFLDWAEASRHSVVDFLEGPVERQ